MSVVVSDTSPVRALHHVGEVGLLRALYGEVLVPEAVADELLNPAGLYEPVDVRAFDFIRISPPAAVEWDVPADLDAGEVAAIALAEQEGASLLLIDELAGRRFASSRGLTIKGALGVLVDAKKAGLVPAVAPLVDRLQREFKFHVATNVRKMILQLADEEMSQD